jgi:hypothetical protein
VSGDRKTLPIAEGDDARRVAPAVARNRAAILEVLAARLPPGGQVLEIASGSGEHAVFFASALPGVSWQPSDRGDEPLGSIAAWRAEARLANLLPPLRLDAASPGTWPAVGADAVVAINLIHIASWAATQGLMAGAAQVLGVGGMLFLYGPFREADVPTVESNLAFDASLRARDPAWGLRDLAEVAVLAARHDLRLSERLVMPANNLGVVFRKSWPRSV